MWPSITSPSCSQYQHSPAPADFAVEGGKIGRCAAVAILAPDEAQLRRVGLIAIEQCQGVVDHREVATLRRLGIDAADKGVAEDEDVSRRIGLSGAFVPRKGYGVDAVATGPPFLALEKRCPLGRLAHRDAQARCSGLLFFGHVGVVGFCCQRAMRAWLAELE